MRYLKTYTKFNEKVEINDTDTEDVKMSKEKMNKLEGYMTEYTQKKSQIDAIFKDLKKDDKQISIELQNLLGKEDAGEGADRNPFLVDYAEVSKMMRKVDDIQNKRALDKIKLDDFNQQLSLTKDADVKVNISSTISDINNRLADKSKEITELQKEIDEKKKALEQKMVEQKKEIDEFIKKINDEEQKKEKM
jgi:uncharacterized protein involved in exopolysaccharide biosynthesis